MSGHFPKIRTPVTPQSRVGEAAAGTRPRGTQHGKLP